MRSQADKGTSFRALHEQAAAFVIPNPWDVGTARLLARLGFQALATTSAGYAFSVGRRDGTVGRHDMMAHVGAIANATDLPVSASAPSGFLITADPMPGESVGLFFYTTTGAAATPVQTAFGLQCIDPGGLFRILPSQFSGGTTGVCDGQLTLDFNAHFATQTQDPALVAGATVDLQAWYRDPPNAGGANLTGALSFVMCP